MKRKELPEKLFEKINLVEPYPNLVVPIRSMIDITGFFPGCKGLWQEEESDDFPSILILGQDFSTEKQYMKMLENKASDISSPTWRNLRKLFAQANVKLSECFFSNAFMGLRQTKSMTGRFPGFKDREFVNRNVKFLLFQINTIKPKIIITLGKYPSELISMLSDDLICWRNNGALTQKDIGLKKFVKMNDNSITCVALEHPSMRNVNVKRRRYKNFMGNEAEVNMLKDASNTIICRGDYK